MDKATLDFLRLHKEKLYGRVIEVGSLFVNGSVRDVIDVAVGVDMRAGKGVDLVCPVEDLLDHFQPETFDSCVSAGTLEHVNDWKAFIRVTWALVKPNGWLVMTMAHLNKGRHDYPNDYWRMTEDHLRTIYPNVEWIGDVGRRGKPASIGWVVHKKGGLGSLDFEPITVK